MTLQFIHKTNRASKASSLYCQWILTGQGESERLAAVWIDPEMRAFEAGFAQETRRNEKSALVARVAGELPLNIQENEAGEIRIEEV